MTSSGSNLLHPPSFFICVRCFAWMCSFVSVVHWVVCILVCNSGVHFCSHFCLVLLMYYYVHVYYVLLFVHDQNCIWQLQEPVFTQTLLSLVVSFFFVLCFFFFPIKVCLELVNKMSSPSNPCHFCSSDFHVCFIRFSKLFRVRLMFSCILCCDYYVSSKEMHLEIAKKNELSNRFVFWKLQT